MQLIRSVGLRRSSAKEIEAEAKAVLKSIDQMQDYLGNLAQNIALKFDQQRPNPGIGRAFGAAVKR